MNKGTKPHQFRSCNLKTNGSRRSKNQKK